MPANYPKKEDLKKYKESGSYPLHESTNPGILDLDIHPSKE